MGRLLLLGSCLVMMSGGAMAEVVTTGAFRGERAIVLLPETGPTTAAFELSYPANAISEPGQFVRWTLQTTSPGQDASLCFRWTDSFTGPTAGYHFLQLLLDEKVLWEHDVAGGDLLPQCVEVPLPKQNLPPAGQPLNLSFRLLEKKQVTNFPVRVQVAEPTLHIGKQAIALMTRTPLPRAEPWPPEPPLSSLPVIGDWTWQANIIQPWGVTQTVAIKEAAQWAPRFAREHGLNAMIVLPPEAHNAVTDAFYKQDDPHHLTDDEFRQALAHYRREGIRLILYSSVMHMGHAPQWQFGEIAKAHPEWAMRDPVGDTVNMYGNPWLCPSTGALQATIDYTAALVRAYDADAVMLDNNEFMLTESGRWTCYCASCREKFRAYLVARFGQGRIAGTDLEAASAAMPEDGTHPLWGLWLSFRNRVWAEACEAFRQQLRQIKPNLVLLANTQYQYSSAVLAVDGQHAHLDAVLSESRGHSSLQMAGKMLLGRALAQGRPLWNYIGTFDEKDFKRLRPPEEVAGICAASAAVGANPWIVFYGFTGEENQPSLAMLRRYTDFWRDNADLLGASKLRGEVGVLVSTESRDLLQISLLPPLANTLLREGMTVRPLRDRPNLTAESLAGLQVLTATANPCMTDEAARAVAAWVRRGGTLIVSPATGWRDPYGRWRRQSVISEALQTRVRTSGEHRCGRGRVMCVADDTATLQIVRQRVHSPVKAATPVAVFHHEAKHSRTVLSLVGLEATIGEVTIELPADVRQVELHMPGHEPQKLTTTKTITCAIPERLGLIVY